MKKSKVKLALFYNLKSIDENITYRYNEDGIRVSKLVGNNVTNYFLEGTQIVYETRGNDVLYYIRDENNSLVGIVFNRIKYYYKKNNQNDVIGIYDSNYNQIVSYEYDCYGKLISIKDNNGKEITDNIHIGIINPFRYRSYYYDNETGYYYLNSRYYNPEWGSFINADGIINASKDIIGHNLYQYCSNNFVNFVDYTGTMPWVIPKLAEDFSNLLDPLFNREKIKHNVNALIGAIIDSFVFEVGSGTGYAFDIKTPIGEVGAEDCKDNNIVFKKGKLFKKDNHSVSISIIGAGITKEIVDENYNGPVLFGPGETSFSIFGTDVTKEGVFVGFEINIHFFVGGHIKMGFEIEW